MQYIYMHVARHVLLLAPVVLLYNIYYICKSLYIYVVDQVSFSPPCALRIYI